MMIGLIPALVSVLILCTVFLFVILKSTHAVEQANRENISWQAAGTVDTALSDALNICSGIQESAWFHDQFISYALGNRKLNALEKEQASTELSTLAAKNYQFVSRIAFVWYGKEDTLYSSSGIYENLSFYQEQYPGRLDYTFLPYAPDGISEVNVDGREYLLYATGLKAVSGGSDRARINIFISKDSLKKELKGVTGNQAASCSILSKDLQALSTIGIEPFDGERLVTEDRTSTELPVVIRVSIPYSVDKKTTRETLPLTIVVILIDIAICVALAVYYTRKSYRPFRETVDLYAGERLASENELEALGRVMNQAFRDRDTAIDSLNQLYPLARQRMIRGYLDGSAFLGESSNDLLCRLGLQFKSKQFRVLAVRMNLMDLLEEKPEPGMELQMAALAMENYVSKATEGLRLQAWLYIHSAEEFSVILNYNQQEDCTRFIERLYDCCSQAELSSKEEITVLIGVGNAVDQARNIHISANQSEFSLNYSSIREGSGIAYYADVVREAKIQIYLPRSEELLLAKAVGNGDIEEVRSIVESLTEANRAAASPGSISMLFAALCCVIISTAQEFGIDIPTTGDDRLPNSLEEVQQRLISLSKTVCEGVKGHRGSMLTEEDKKIKDYIDSHICDSNLSLRALAQKYNRSQASLSESFKRLTGKKYIDYINEKRIQKAVELMLSENLDFNTVYTKVGYVSISTFRRNYQRYAKKGNDS